MNSKDPLIVPKPAPAEIMLLVPKTIENRRSVLAAADALARQAGASPNVVTSPEELQKLLRLTATNTSLVVMPKDLADLAATIERAHGDREDSGRPTTRFIVLSDKEFPSGKLPPHTRVFPLCESEGARAALALAIKASGEEGLASLRNQVSRI